MNINGYTLKQTCGACPEQYDVLLDGNHVGHLRLRHGYFYAYIGEYCCGGEVAYEAHPQGDGIFECDERDYYLTEAIKAIDNKLKDAA